MREAHPARDRPGDRPGDREAWVDHARGLGIALVVYGHVARGLMTAGILPDGGVWRSIDEAIYAFHMPLFFFLSGLYFLPSLRRRGRRGLIVSKIETVLYPYVLWTLLHGSIKVLMSDHTNDRELSLAQVTKLWIPLDHLWFLFGLFLVFLGSLLPMPVARRDLLPSLGALALVLYATRGSLPLPWQQIYLVPFGVYFAMGSAYAEGSRILPPRSLTPACFAVGATLLAVLLWRHGADELLSPWGASAPSGRTLMLATAGILLTCGLARVSARLRLPGVAALGSASLLIYVSHTLFASATRIGLDRGLGIEEPLLHLGLGLAAGLGMPLVILLVGEERVSPLLRATGPLRLRRLLRRDRAAAATIAAATATATAHNAEPEPPSSRA